MAHNKKILIVDDDRDLSELIKDMLTDKGYEVTLAFSIEEAFAYLEKQQFHLIILDINLPDGTGFELCRELRRVSTIPVIFASARTSEDDKVIGLDMGGDDYIAKPYSIKELLSRVNSLLRRTYGFEKEAEKLLLRAGKDNVIEIDTESRTVTRNGNEVKLSLREYDLLVYMADKKGQAIHKETLLSNVWGTFSWVEPSTLTVHIRWLREKLEVEPSNPVFIMTVWGVGYKLEEVFDEE